ncbi:MAG: hypothetical protein ACE5LV_08830 [Candidatus Aminicenantales bacterium]
MRAGKWNEIATASSRPRDDCHGASLLAMTAAASSRPRDDSRIGRRIIYSSLLRSPEILSLLTRTIGVNYKDLITSAEKEFRKTMILYGSAFVPSEEEEVIGLLSVQMAELARAFLQAGGVSIPPELDQDLELVIVLMMQQAILYIQDDYMGEIEATIDHIKSELWSRWVFYF